MNTGASTDRRRFNIMDSIVIATLLGLGALIFDMRDAVMRLEITQETTNKTLALLHSQFAEVPVLNVRVTRLEIRQDANIEAIKELRSTRRLK